MATTCSPPYTDPLGICKNNPLCKSYLRCPPTLEQIIVVGETTRDFLTDVVKKHPVFSNLSNIITSSVQILLFIFLFLALGLVFIILYGLGLYNMLSFNQFMVLFVSSFLFMLFVLGIGFLWLYATVIKPNFIDTGDFSFEKILKKYEIELALKYGATLLLDRTPCCPNLVQEVGNLIRPVVTDVRNVVTDVKNAVTDVEQNIMNRVIPKVESGIKTLETDILKRTIPQLDTNIMNKTIPSVASTIQILQDIKIPTFQKSKFKKENVCSNSNESII